ncbi:glycosyltransferase [Apibacter adventoris]|uniref:glycosyltransferase n=1 Tax=Apibacter adventoris TaxID=1679466 RepID=UPI000CF66E15|nr:glycosyltransferase [Apibacter adventoris]PQL93561.1 glycosyl transferase family 2 [Apibacter adventoris]
MHGDLRVQFSLIIAVYNRKDELRELLNSLVEQTDKNFEVIIVDDGSAEKLESVALNYSGKLDIKYDYKQNSGAGLARNYGCKKANGNYFIFLDSDCIVPKHYIENVRKELYTRYTDAFGGADAADKNFNTLQKAISYSMTSLFTTGGIRGNKKSVDKFQPRSFNMGISREAFQDTGGFSELRVGEDPDLTLTLWEKGFQTRFFPDCKVFHKRRATLNKFARQVYHFGIARPILNQRHPTYAKITFWFPSLFMIGTIIAVLCGLFYFFISQKLYHFAVWGAYSSTITAIREISLIPFILLCIYSILLISDSSIKNKSLTVGLLSWITTFIQFFSYGFGFLQSFIVLNILKQKPQKAFPSHFYTQ